MSVSNVYNYTYFSVAYSYRRYTATKCLEICIFRRTNWKTESMISILKQWTPEHLAR